MEQLWKAIALLNNHFAYIDTGMDARSAWDFVRKYLEAQPQATSKQSTPCQERVDCIHQPVCCLGKCGGRYYRNG